MLKNNFLVNKRSPCNRFMNDKVIVLKNQFLCIARQSETVWTCLYLVRSSFTNGKHKRFCNAAY